jgi:hypothetical protein
LFHKGDRHFLFTVALRLILSNPLMRGYSSRSVMLTSYSRLVPTVKKYSSCTSIRRPSLIVGCSSNPSAFISSLLTVQLRLLPSVNHSGSQHLETLQLLNNGSHVLYHLKSNGAVNAERVERLEMKLGP